MPSNPTTKRPRGRPPKPKPVLHWRDRLKLQPGETLRRSGGTKSGNLDQHEVEMYDVIDLRGDSVGTVLYTETFCIRPPFRANHSLVQKDPDGKVVVDLRW